jgi:3-phosphoshikimate 1-carboxyvinyltransferase
MGTSPSTINYPPYLDVLPYSGVINADVVLPGSKSISNRALILAALGNGPVTLSNMLFSRDTEIMMSALRQLGFSLQVDAQQLTVQITGQNGKIPQKSARIHVGNAGTAARFLTAFLALQEDGVYYMDGDEAMYRRPMSGLLSALESQGCEIEYHGQSGHFPFTLKSNGLRGGTLRLDASESSQILSALLMVGPFSHTPLNLELTGPTVSWPFVEITLKMIEEFGLGTTQVSSDHSRFTSVATKGKSNPTEYAIEPDITAASYFMVLPLVHGGQIRFPQLTQSDVKQGDIAFASVLQQLGVEIVWDNVRGLTLSVPSPQAWKSNRRTSTNTHDYDFNAFSDTFLTLAALAPLYSESISIRGIAHTRKQETDRVSAMATELRKIGISVSESEDQLSIAATSDYHPPHPLSPIHTYEDHRVAMSFGILSTWDALGNGQPWLRIEDPGCCRKTFPHFFSVLEQTLGRA